MTVFGSTPNCRGFNYFSGFYNAYEDYWKHTANEYLDLRENFEVDDKQKDHYGPELVTQKVQQWITRKVKEEQTDKKTFAYVAHQAVHAPNQVPMRYVKQGQCESFIPIDQPIRLALCGMVCRICTLIVYAILMPLCIICKL